MLPYNYKLCSSLAPISTSDSKSKLKIRPNRKVYFKLSTKHSLCYLLWFGSQSTKQSARKLCTEKQPKKCLLLRTFDLMDYYVIKTFYRDVMLLCLHQHEIWDEMTWIKTLFIHLLAGRKILQLIWILSMHQFYGIIIIALYYSTSVHTRDCGRFCYILILTTMDYVWKRSGISYQRLCCQYAGSRP